MSPQRYVAAGRQLEIDPAILLNAVETMKRIQAIDRRLFPLLTLNHLSHATGLSYSFLRASVGRRSGRYRHFYMKKKVPGRRNTRMISIPEKKLRVCQRWIVDNILSYSDPHESSYAFHPDSSPVRAAWVHTEAKWLIKVDIQDFFHAISEHQIYKAFRSLGYGRLISFELSRLCTMACERSSADFADTKYYDSEIAYYQSPHVGILPQGAPTSPMLSNLVMKDVDDALAQLAVSTGMRYSRYADDIVFSCHNNRDHREINRTKRMILRNLNESGFRPNLRKTVVRGPGARKVVLGLLVDTDKPRLPKEFKDRMRLHLHYLTHPNFGPAHHARVREMSTTQLYHHVFGLICWARAVEPNYGRRVLAKFDSIKWPPISRPRYYSAT